MDLIIKDVALREIQESDLPVLCDIYGSTRTEELDEGTDWNEEQKRFFIEHQFNAQHDYYQKNYSEEKNYIFDMSKIRIAKLYMGLC